MGSFSDKFRNQVVPQAIKNKLVARIYGKGRGWVFTPNHFSDLGARAIIDKTLGRLVEAGTIRRLARGLYDYPRTHPKLGALNPSPEMIAQAISKSDMTRLQPSGAYAANLLGLSDQVPAKIVFLTDGAEKTIKVGKQRIRLRRTTPKNMATADRISGLVIQAFRYLGKDHVRPSHVNGLRDKLPSDDKTRLWRDRVYAPAWMRPYLKQISEDVA